MVLHLLFPLLWIATVVEASASQNVSVKPRCQSKCGNVDIPYPFGIGDGCFFDGVGFEITCNATFAPPKPFKGGVEVLDISVLTAEMSIAVNLSWDCYNSTGQMTSSSFRRVQLEGNSLFTFSDTRNKFTAIGCDTIGRFYGSGGEFISECGSLCNGTANVIDGSCSGEGCCQLTIPKGLKRYEVKLSSFYNHTSIWNFNWCSFAFLADQDVFSFNASDLQGIDLWKRTPSVPVVLDWAIGSEKCNSSLSNSTTYACTSENSECYNSTNGLGYGCNCSLGFEGNPYLPGGCQDVDECELQMNGCSQVCTNTRGSYFCSCRKGYNLVNQRDCTEDATQFPVLKVALGVGIGLFLLVVACSISCWWWRKTKLMRLKEKFFKQNGGLLLQEKIFSHKISPETFKIFSTDELEKATDNYDESRKLGEGGQGTVYKGILPDNRIVAIKKSKIVDVNQIKSFVNEIHILSEIKHRNIVKLLGCCLDTEVPLLVYEFISNGSLEHHIHGGGHASSISWNDRLRIAAETAGALYYLHSAAAEPIFHGDVKSANILLDDHLTAKVSDFGGSRLVPVDQTQVATLVQYTLGYLDPESLQTGHLTEKSDVYSFGIILVELLTGEKPFSCTRSPQKMNLSVHFVSAMNEDRLFQVLEDSVRRQGSVEQLRAVAYLALRCLEARGIERPTMKEVLVELEELRRHDEYFWDSKDDEETELLI